MIRSPTPLLNTKLKELPKNTTKRDLTDDRLNFFTPTRKPVTWVKDSSGQRKRIYDEPATPLDRLSEAGVMSPSQESELITYRNSLDPAQLTSEIGHWQERLKSISTL